MSVTVAYSNKKTVNTLIKKASTIVMFSHAVSLIVPVQAEDVSFYDIKGEIHSSIEAQVTPRIYSNIKKPLPSFVVSQSPTMVKGMKAMGPERSKESVDQEAFEDVAMFDRDMFNVREETDFKVQKVALNVPITLNYATALSVSERDDFMNHDREEPNVVVNNIRYNIPLNLNGNMQDGSELS